MNSQDLNPIENLWTIMKDKVAYMQPSSAENMRQATKEVWVTVITQEAANLSGITHSVTSKQSLAAKEDTKY